MAVLKDSELFELEKRISTKFKNKALLVQALTHRSYLNEHPELSLEHNERLEFLGDAVLELVVTEYLYQNYDKPEGELTNWRAALVNSKMLASVAKDLNLNGCLLLSRGEAKDEGRAREYILANACEAIIGAVYLDQGYKGAQKFIVKHILSRLPQVLREEKYKDPKSKFQEKAQEVAGITPSYHVLDEWGPDHMKRFRVGVYLGEEKIAEGESYSKQTAQEEAANRALKAKGWS